MKDKKLIALCGPSGSGKDYYLSHFCHYRKDLFHKVILHTTRPKRQKEVDGEHYYFISSEEMQEKLLSGDLISVTVFRDWFYGVSKEALSEDKINIGAFSPEAIIQLAEEPGICLAGVFWIEGDNRERLLRSLDREPSSVDVDEVVRRYLSDKKDFEIFTNEFWDNLDFVDIFKKKMINRNNNGIDFIDIVHTIEMFAQTLID